MPSYFLVYSYPHSRYGRFWGSIRDQTAKGVAFYPPNWRASKQAPNWRGLKLFHVKNRYGMTQNNWQCRPSTGWHCQPNHCPIFLKSSCSPWLRSLREQGQMDLLNKVSDGIIYNTISSENGCCLQCLSDSLVTNGRFLGKSQWKMSSAGVKGVPCRARDWNLAAARMVITK